MNLSVAVLLRLLAMTESCVLSWWVKVVQRSIEVALESRMSASQLQKVMLLCCLCC